MTIVSSKDYSGAANGTLLINASGQTGSAFRRASYSEDTAPGTAVIQGGVVIPGQGGNDTMFYEDPTPLGSANQTIRARKYTGDHGFGQISVFCQRTGGVNTGYAVDWLQGVSWALKKNGAQIATGGAGTFHDQTVDIYLDSRETVPGTRRLRLTIRRVSDGFYYNGSTFQSVAVDLIDFSDSTSPITAIGVSGFGARLNTATPISLAQWEIDGAVSAVDTAPPDVTSTGTGPTNGPFTVTVAENSTAVAVTLTSSEALSTVTKAGVDGALFTLAGSGITRTLAPTAAFDFESLPHANPFVVTLTFQDTAAPTPNERTVTVNFTVTNVNEAPTFGGTLSVPTLTEGVAMTPVNAALLFTDPDSGDTGTYSQVGTWPAGVTCSGAGSISGTPTTAGTYTNLRVRRTDVGGLAADSNLFTITVSGPPVLSAPTKSTPTATTAIGGFTTDNATGTARMVWTLLSTQPSIAQVKAGQNSAGTTVGALAPAALTITSTGAKNFAAATVTQGATYYGWVVHTDGSGNDSAVLALGRVYPGSGRPASDVAAGGYTPSTGTVLADMLNEDAPGDDANYITSPTLSGTPVSCTLALDKTYGAGTYSGIKVRKWTSTGTGTFRIRFLNNAGAVMGVTADQAMNTTPTLYTLSVTLTGPATRIQIEEQT